VIGSKLFPRHELPDISEAWHIFPPARRNCLFSSFFQIASRKLDKHRWLIRGGKSNDARLLDLQQALGAIGLKLNHAKCRLWGPRIQTADQELPTFPLGLAPAHPRRSIQVIPFGGATGITTLGVPDDATKGGPGGGQPAAPECEAKWGAAVEHTNLLLQRLRLNPGFLCFFKRN